METEHHEIVSWAPYSSLTLSIVVVDQDKNKIRERRGENGNMKEVQDHTFPWLVPKVASSKTALLCPCSNIIWN